MMLIDGLVQTDQDACGYLLADTTHDTNRLHEHAAGHSFQLITPRKTPHAGLGHCKHCSARLRSIALLEAPASFGRTLYGSRGQIERHFGNLCSFGGGLQPLPSWVRRPRRVTRWIIAKLIINALRQCQKQGLAA